jgi:hypothetical protein
VSAASDHAELSTLLSALEETIDRIVAVADRYRDTDDSMVAADLDQAERGLVTGRRAISRALANLRDLT